MFAGYENLRNGFRDQGNQRDIANVERVEILIGPSSVLYGGGSSFSLSGLVNTVTKKPLDSPFYQGQLTIGSFDFYRPTIDITGPLLSDRSALYRLNLAYENSNSYRDFVSSENFFIAPVLTLQISPRTTFTTEFEYLDYSYIFDKGLPLDPVSLKLPVNRFIGEPNLDPTTGNVASISGNLEHQFSDNWKFRQGLNATINNTEVGNARIYSISLRDDGRTLDRTSSQGAQKTENYTLQTEISGKFNTGSLRHNVLFGVELARFKIATYAYTDIVVTEDNNPDLIGDRTAGVPEHSASLWTTYEIQNGNLQGLGFGLGLVYAAEREVSLPNTFTVPSYLRTDASVFYRRSNYRVGLNVKNLFDVKYYEVDGFSLLPAAPLTVLGTFAVEF
ncbi:TonB-dependent siderophore receptor [Fischerella sp. NIES-3754]|uniref:TonB-dependent siderophore receptor n=1 Tax=Fischerella sp. NIES-3754 TaxID=1752063 RepID=UPI00072253C4|nr:TonB-dependent receptor [Fischerella sp. NIES-3754]BAU08400.1 ferrichrome iron receptor [Fischerella sp. NIES-3754]BCX10771.1 MAG: hypothetical protein KatS3mg066_4630 [Fischerella sp.]